MALIYILEDDRNIREIEEIALKNADYEVVSFETAAEFGKRMKERVPDLLLLDLMLPDADGPSACDAAAAECDDYGPAGYYGDCEDNGNRQSTGT